jgi:GxxExxY protein
MPRNGLRDERLTGSVIGAFYEVYNVLGYGLLESLYAAALEHELRARGHRVAREVAVRVTYKGTAIGWQRLDMVVDGRLVVETKSTERLHPLAVRQLLSYLHATGLGVGLLLHFGPEATFRRVARAGVDARQASTDEDGSNGSNGSGG